MLTVRSFVTFAVLLCRCRLKTNVRVFTTLQQAMEASLTYPDHTYIHIVNEHGRLQRVFIRVHGSLIPIRLESEVDTTRSMTYIERYVHY
jgi:hypothetical protein